MSVSSTYKSDAGNTGLSSGQFGMAVSTLEVEVCILVPFFLVFCFGGIELGYVGVQPVPVLQGCRVWSRQLSVDLFKSLICYMGPQSLIGSNSKDFKGDLRKNDTHEANRRIAIFVKVFMAMVHHSSITVREREVVTSERCRKDHQTLLILAWIYVLQALKSDPLWRTHLEWGRICKIEASHARFRLISYPTQPPVSMFQCLLTRQINNSQNDSCHP